MTTLYVPAVVIWGRIVARTDITADCWNWQGCVNSRGYGCIASGKRGKTALVHRVAVLVRDGELDDEAQIDHLCRNRRCVRPDHLDVVDGAGNQRRSAAARGHHIGGKCHAGHLLTEETVYYHPRGQLVCRLCAREQRKPNGRPSQIRAWARANGLEVAARGALSRAVINAYKEAQAVA